jgi:hypothetical protein
MHHALGDARQKQGETEYGEQHDGGPAAVLIGLRDPAATHGRKRRNHGERQTHAREQRQAALHERLVRAREHERKHGQDARTENRQRAAEIGKDDEQHDDVGSDLVVV